MKSIENVGKTDKNKHKHDLMSECKDLFRKGHFFSVLHDQLKLV